MGVMDKKKIQQKVRDSVRSGVLVKQNICELCKRKLKFASIAGHHHRGYEYPLDVLWVCQPCHAKIHDQAPRGERSSKAVLSQEQVLEIRGRYNGKWGSQSSLAK